MHPVRPLPSSSFARSSGVSESGVSESTATGVSAAVAGPSQEFGDHEMADHPHRRPSVQSRRLSFLQGTLFHEKARCPDECAMRGRERLASHLLQRQTILQQVWDQLQRAVEVEQAGAELAGRSRLSAAEQRLLEAPLAAALGSLAAPKGPRAWQWQPYCRQDLTDLVAQRGYDLAQRLLSELCVMWSALHDAWEAETPRFAESWLPESWRGDAAVRSHPRPLEEALKRFTGYLTELDPQATEIWSQESGLTETLGILQARQGPRLVPAVARLVEMARQRPLMPTAKLSVVLLQMVRVALDERAHGTAVEILGALGGDARHLPLSLNVSLGLASSSFRGSRVEEGAIILQEAPALSEEQREELKRLWRSSIQAEAPSYQPAYPEAYAAGRCLSLGCWACAGGLDRAVVLEALADLESEDQVALLEHGPLWVGNGLSLREDETTRSQRIAWWQAVQQSLRAQFCERGRVLLEQVTGASWPGAALSQCLLENWGRALPQMDAAQALAALERAERVLEVAITQVKLEGDWRSIREWAARWVAEGQPSLEILMERIARLAPALSRDAQQAYLGLEDRLVDLIDRLAAMEAEPAAAAAGAAGRGERARRALSAALGHLLVQWRGLAEAAADPRQEALLAGLDRTLQALDWWSQSASSARSSRGRTYRRGLEIWLDQASRFRVFAPSGGERAQRLEIALLSKEIELEAVQQLYGPWAAASRLSVQVLGSPEGGALGDRPLPRVDQEDLAMAIVERAQLADDYVFVGAVCRNLLRGVSWIDGGKKAEEAHAQFSAAAGQGLFCWRRSWTPGLLLERREWMMTQSLILLRQRMHVMSKVLRPQKRDPHLLAIGALIKLVIEYALPEEQERFLAAAAPALALRPDPILSLLRRSSNPDLVASVERALTNEPNGKAGRA